MEKNSQFLMSEMKTANPRIPSPFDTAGILQDYVLALTLPLKIHVDSFFFPFFCTRPKWTKATLTFGSDTLLSSSKRSLQRCD